MIREPKCSKRKCKYYQGIIKPDGSEKTEQPACQAYPDGIPNDIAYGDDKHLEVRDDQDNDITYKKEEE